MNFSYWVFKKRGRLRRYFRRAYAALAPDGILYLDAYGDEAFKVLKERTPYRGYTYVWHQAAYDPISRDTLCHIDFKFEDGSRLRRAFSYDWRLWTPARAPRGPDRSRVPALHGVLAGQRRAHRGPCRSFFGTGRLRAP